MCKCTPYVPIVLQLLRMTHQSEAEAVEYGYRPLVAHVHINRTPARARSRAVVAAGHHKTKQYINSILC